MDNILNNLKELKYKIKYFFESFSFLSTLFSPFKPLSLKFYFGPIKIGQPYFLPRKLNKERKYVQLKWFGFDYNGLGWKTKFDSIRFEWNPSYSFIILNKQFNIMFSPSVMFIDTYWEGWLTYNYRTDKKLSKKERMIQVFEQYSCKWTSYKNNEKITEDHYFNILRKEYIPLYQDWLNSKDPVYKRNEKIEEIIK
jgi:hypothetical protein